MTATAGYPVHAVLKYRQHTNPYGIVITDWTAVCGHTDTRVGLALFGDSLGARKAELCKQCFPSGHRSPGLPEKPVDVSA